MSDESEWLSEFIDPASMETAVLAGSSRLVDHALGREPSPPSDDEVWTSELVEALAWDRIVTDPTSVEAKQFSRRAFQFKRGLSSHQGTQPFDALRLACLAWVGDETALASRSLVSLEPVGDQPADWAGELDRAVELCWSVLLRTTSWDDIALVRSTIRKINSDKPSREKAYVFSDSGMGDEAQDRDVARARAWQMVWSYQLLAAAQLVLDYLLSGELQEPDTTYDPQSRIGAYFDRARSAASSAGAIEREELARLLHAAANRLLANSLWAVARGANPLTQQFVRSLLGRDRPRPLLELLPPQRQALAGAGLVRGGRRSIVVSMPTSSGKTLIAQFRILEALNSFQGQKPWVVYVAPSRALVNQVTRRLRLDFRPLGLNVEQVSPALEVDGVEAALLTEQADAAQFDILVSTPEKLDLLLRSDWREKIDRPLVLIVVDEAHSLAEEVRGVRLELLLATINREVRDAQFLLLTPFIDNAEQIARWLDPSSHEGVQLELDWSPNDRIIALANRKRGPKAGDFSVQLETLITSRQTLHSDASYPLGANRPLGVTWSGAASQGVLAAATAAQLGTRGSTITIVQQPRYSWKVAEQIAGGTADVHSTADLAAVATLVRDEYGENHPLTGFLQKGVGVHHTGLSPELRSLMEWLTESGELTHLVATTTIAAGVNFPVSNVVLASHQYPYGEDMSPAEFWNLAGRAGRVDQGQVGLIALASSDAAKDAKLRTFVDRQVNHLNSALVTMVENAIASAGRLELQSLSHMPQWSSFVQFLAHSFRQVGRADIFSQTVESLLRGTLGYQELRRRSEPNANELLRAVHAYGQRLQGAPLALVDATGFSVESVSNTLARISEARLSAEVWRDDMFLTDRGALAEVVGVMLQVPELRDELLEGADDSRGGPGTFLANVLSDWVNGSPLSEIASQYYARKGESALDSITRASQRIFRHIAPTMAWGISAVQSMTISESSSVPESVRNFPAFAFYGVNSEIDVAMRLAGLPRPVVGALRPNFDTSGQVPTPQYVRSTLNGLSPGEWDSALGARATAYRRLWQIIDGAV